MRGQCGQRHGGLPQSEGGEDPARGSGWMKSWEEGENATMQRGLVSGFPRPPPPHPGKGQSQGGCEDPRLRSDTATQTPQPVLAHQGVPLLPAGTTQRSPAPLAPPLRPWKWQFPPEAWKQDRVLATGTDRQAKVILPAGHGENTL